MKNKTTLFNLILLFVLEFCIALILIKNQIELSTIIFILLSIFLYAITIRVIRLSENDRPAGLLIIDDDIELHLGLDLNQLKKKNKISLRVYNRNTNTQYNEKEENL